MNRTLSMLFAVDKRTLKLMNSIKSTRATISDFAREPFRIFFPAGVLAGIGGVALWPLHFLGVMDFYPGLGHARIMACGLFGAFILGFLGTAMPRMLSVTPLSVSQVLPLVAIHVPMVVAFACSKILVGDVLFLMLLAMFVGVMAVRAKQRKDTPPPGFILVGLSFLSVTSAMSAAAQSTTNYNGQINTITTAVPFLRISPDARSGAMGDAGIAITPDANAQYWNLGKLPFATKKYGIAF